MLSFNTLRRSDPCALGWECEIASMLRKITKTKTRLIILLALLFLVFSYLYAINSKPLLDEQARQAAPGHFIQLGKGLVHYELTGPASATTVVLVHGLATPSFIWDNNSQAMLDAGFRVLRYDHYGRGFSDRPDVVYDRDLYIQQLDELLTKLAIKSPVHLVGLSMGGAVVTSFTDRLPERVASLGLIAPAGFPIEESLAMKVGKLPILGDYLMAVIGDWVVWEGVKEAFVHPDNLTTEFEEKFKVPLRYAGFQRAILSTLRDMDMNNMAEIYQRVGKLQTPSLLIWGRKDAVLPFSNSEKVQAAIPHVTLNAVDGAGHNLNYENPEIVNSKLLAFLAQQKK